MKKVRSAVEISDIAGLSYIFYGSRSRVKRLDGEASATMAT